MQNDWGWCDLKRDIKEFNEIKDIKDSVRFVKLFNTFNIIIPPCSTGYIFVTRPIKTYGTYKTYGSL